MIYRILLFSFMVICSLSSMSQINIPLTIEGIVMNQKGDKLFGAAVSDYRGIYMASTDFDGRFYMEMQNESMEISISYVGYQTLETSIEISDLKLVDGFYSMDFVLSPSTEQLAVVQITAERIERVYDKPEILIYDFQFYGDDILLLLKSNRKRYIRLIDDKSNTLLEKELDFRALELKKACMGDILIIDDAQVFRIEIQEEIELVKECTLEYFQQYIQPCVATTPGHLLTAQFGTHNKSLRYMIAEITSGDAQVLDYVVDREAQMAAAFQLMRLESAGDVNGAADMDLKGLARSREIFQDRSYYELIMTRPIYAPLLTLEKDVYVFDHVNGEIRTFDYSGLPIASYEMSYHKNHDEIEELIKDDYLNDVYALHYRGSLARLIKIDHKTGEEVQEFRLDEHSFPEKIKIRNGYAYYIYQEKRDLSNPNIFRQPLY